MTSAKWSLGARARGAADVGGYRVGAADGGRGGETPAVRAFPAFSLRDANECQRLEATENGPFKDAPSRSTNTHVLAH